MINGRPRVSESSRKPRSPSFRRMHRCVNFFSEPEPRFSSRQARATRFGGTGAGGGSVTTFATSTGGQADVGGSCVDIPSKAEPVPLDIFLMLDQSGSMNMDAGNGERRWDVVRDAIASFVNEPTSAGIAMGVQYVGLPQPDITGCWAQSCT